MILSEDAESKLGLHVGRASGQPQNYSSSSTTSPRSALVAAGMYIFSCCKPGT